MEQRQEEICRLIPKGHENAIDRLELMSETGLTYQGLKRVLSKLNQEGIFIGNMQDGKGYFQFDLPKELELMEVYIKQESARAYEVLKRIRKMSGEARKLRFGADLKATRLAKGYTQKELSVITDITPQRISQLETLKDTPTNEEIRKLRKALE